MDYANDKRIVVTLDAGGTNLVFAAMCGGGYITEPITLDSHADDLDACMGAITRGFEQTIGALDRKPAAISFAFPGPADYPDGIIDGQMLNFPSFRGGVALGPYLEQRFGLPVYINNDGDLYAYGEALGGILPEVNARLREAGSGKRFRNLIGITLGTGLGIGMVIDGRLNTGDNACVEAAFLRNPREPDLVLEEGISIRAVQHVYGNGLTPKEIFEIAEGRRPGDIEAARRSFAELGGLLGELIATAGGLVDGLVVIGGGLSGAHRHFMPTLLKTLRGELHTRDGRAYGRLPMDVYDLGDERQFADFARGERREMKLYGSEKTIAYDAQKRTGIAISRIGTNRAVALGAYCFALTQLNRENGTRFLSKSF